MYCNAQHFILATGGKGGKGVMAGNPDVSNEWKSVSVMSDTGSSLLRPGFSVPPVGRGPPHGLGFHT